VLLGLVLGEVRVLLLCGEDAITIFVHILCPHRDRCVSHAGSIRYASSNPRLRSGRRTRCPCSIANGRTNSVEGCHQLWSRAPMTVIVVIT
jgi:hypothetical protein